MEPKADKLPKSALKLYVKLYCKKKRGADKYNNNRSLIEAIKSWVSLSEQEKQQFADKLDECRLMYRNRFADYLKNAEPYLKKKSKRINSEQVEETVNASLQTNTNTEELLDNESKDTSAAGSKNECDGRNISWIENLTEAEVSQNSESEEDQELSIEPLPEPTPPFVRTAKQLFTIVSETNEENDKTWATLSNLEKSRYRNAVLTLKKEYIMKYNLYLKSLPSKQLFDYYNENIDK